MHKSFVTIVQGQIVKGDLLDFSSDTIPQEITSFFGKRDIDREKAFILVNVTITPSRPQTKFISVPYAVIYESQLYGFGEEAAYQVLE